MIKVVFWLLLAAAGAVIRSLEELAQSHCGRFPLDDLLRLAEGRLSEKHGMHLAGLDAYVRKFIGRDRHYTAAEYEQGEQDEYADEPEEEAQQQPVEDDWAAKEYARGLKACGLDWQEEQVFSVWRLVRFMVTHDYFYEWIRGKVRGLTGYTSLLYSSMADYEFRKGERFKL
jgi:hypothetical protein